MSKVYKVEIESADYAEEAHDNSFRVNPLHGLVVWSVLNKKKSLEIDPQVVDF